MEWRLHSLLSNIRLCRRRPNFALIVRTVNLSFRKFGSMEAEEPWILLLHGVLGNKNHWNGVAKTITNITQHAVMTIDLRNHGRSPHTSSHRYTECAEDIIELMSKQRMENAILIGYGMGGRTAMSLALMKPKMVSGLIVVDISPVSTCTEMLTHYPKLFEFMSAVDFSKLEKKTVTFAQKYVKKQLRAKVKDVDDITIRLILANIEVRNGSLTWACNLEVIMKHFKYIATFPTTLLDKSYPGPALFIGGQNSDYLPPDDLPRIRDIFPNSMVLYIPKTGHRVYIDDPKRFMELVINFIKKNKD